MCLIARTNVCSLIWHTLRWNKQLASLNSSGLMPLSVIRFAVLITKGYVYTNAEIQAHRYLNSISNITLWKPFPYFPSHLWAKTFLPSKSLIGLNIEQKKLLSLLQLPEKETGFLQNQIDCNCGCLYTCKNDYLKVCHKVLVLQWSSTYNLSCFVILNSCFAGQAFITFLIRSLTVNYVRREIILKIIFCVLGIQYCILQDGKY